MEEQVIEVEQEVIITNNSLLSHFSNHNNDLPVSKQKNGALNRIMPSLTRPSKKNNNLALGHYFKEGVATQALSYISHSLQRIIYF